MSSAHKPTPAAERVTTRPQRIAWLVGALLGVGMLVTVAHRSVLTAQAYAADDNDYIVYNVRVQNPSWTAAGQFLTEVLEPTTVRGYYQPLTMISLMVDSALGGRPNDLRAYHRTSLSLHACNTLLVIVLLYLLFGKLGIAALVGLLFGLHPQTVEPIAWVSDRKTLLAAFFALGALILYVSHARRTGWVRYGLSLLLFVLALLSKPTVTPLPLLLLLLDFWPLRRLSWKSVLEKVPYFVIAGASAAITYYSQKNSGVVYAPSSLWTIVLTVCHNIVFYLWKLVWPVNLTPRYPLPAPFEWSQPALLAGLIGTAVLLILLGAALRWTRAPLASWLFFLLAVFPTLGLIGFTNVIASDKYIYFPVLGLLILLAFGLGRLWDALSARPFALVVVVVVLLGLGVGEAVATQRYLQRWQDTERLTRYMLTLAPDVADLHDQLGFALKEKGRAAEAIAELETALRLDPNYYHSYNNLGTVLAADNRLEEAVTVFREGVRRMPKLAMLHSNLGRALDLLKRPDEARASYEAALAVAPDCIDAHVGLGFLLAQQGKMDEGAAHLRAAIRIHPRQLQAHIGLARILAAQGKRDEAIALCEAARRFAPENPQLLQELQRLKATRPGATPPRTGP